MKTPKFFIGPMSLNIVDSIIEYSNEKNEILGIIPSRRQIEYCGGYVNKNWKTDDFCNYIKSKTKNILIVRDHAGPDQGIAKDDGIESLIFDCKKGNMDIIHIDVWKKYNENLLEGIEETIKLIEFCYNLNNNILFEIGTEESIKKFDEEDLDFLIIELKKKLKKEIFDNIKYAVIQSGTGLKNTNNIGIYDEERLNRMLKITKKHGLLSKEHNGDFLDESLIYRKFKYGLNSINIAPEFGQIETKYILNEIKKNNMKYFDIFFKICFESGRWEKWVDNNFDPFKNKEETIIISGHYIFSNHEFCDLKNILKIDDNKIKELIKDKINCLFNHE